MEYSGKGAQDYFNELKSDFEAANPLIANPLIKIEFAGYPYGELKKQVLIMANAGESPDIIQCARSWYSSFVSGGYVAELDSLLGKDYIKDIYPEILADMQVDGVTYGIPWKVSPFVLFTIKICSPAPVWIRILLRKRMKRPWAWLQNYRF